ncbi:MAG: hypothetical protein KIT19_01840 [Phycisphaeraceae bacterium]|nr:hypothetical protein [Phycisphaeraceae bacterium]
MARMSTAMRKSRATEQSDEPGWQSAERMGLWRWAGMREESEEEGESEDELNAEDAEERGGGEEGREGKGAESPGEVSRREVVAV